jgi:hypothetical protein
MQEDLTTCAGAAGPGSELGRPCLLIDGVWRRFASALNLSNLLLICVLTIVGVVITRGIKKGEFNYNVDETQHAVTGLYAADLLRDHPIRHPIQYTYRYYAHYPALSGVLHWPPLFYIFEGLCFLVLGPQVEAARISVLLFAFLGLAFWFRLVKYLTNEWVAALTTLLLGLKPCILLFEKTVMLEIPSLALCIAATYFWFRFLLEEDQRAFAWFTGFESAALMTKHNSIYLLLFCVLSVVLLRKYRLFANRYAACVTALALLAVSPFYIAMYLIHWPTVAMDLAGQHVPIYRSLLFYPKVLPDQLGWTPLVLSALGMFTAYYWNKRSGTTALMLSWIVSCYFTFTLIGHKEPRYVLYWIPPFLYFVGGVLANDTLWRRGRVWKSLALGLLLVMTLRSAWSFERPYVEGYAEAARRLTATGKTGVVLYDGDLAGNFIFFVRANDPERRFVVLRKALYVQRIKKPGGSEELIKSRAELVDLVRRYGVRFVLVSDRGTLAFQDQRWLRDLLGTQQFQLSTTFPITTHNEAEVVHSELLLYENLNWQPPTDKNLRIRMLTLGHDIVVPFSELFECERSR